MRWMLVCGYAEWDWMVLTLDYQLSFPSSMYEQYFINSTVDPQPNGLVENSWDSLLADWARYPLVSHSVNWLISSYEPLASLWLVYGCSVMFE